jgi:hypothetical protein
MTNEKKSILMQELETLHNYDLKSQAILELHERLAALEAKQNSEMKPISKEEVMKLLVCNDEQHSFIGKEEFCVCGKEKSNIVNVATATTTECYNRQNIAGFAGHSHDANCAKPTAPDTIKTEPTRLKGRIVRDGDDKFCLQDDGTWIEILKRANQKREE